MFSKNQALCDNYKLYVYALISRALTELGYLQQENVFHAEGRNPIKLREDGFDIQLLIGAKCLKLVPVLSYLPTHELEKTDYTSRYSSHLHLHSSRQS